MFTKTVSNRDAFTACLGQHVCLVRGERSTIRNIYLVW